MGFSLAFNVHGDSKSQVPELIEEANRPMLAGDALSAAAKSTSSMGRSDLGFLLGV